MWAIRIYPEWLKCLRSIHDSQAGPLTYYAKAEEGARQDMQCLFRFLQGRRFHVLGRESDPWNIEELLLESEVCAILHNHSIRRPQYGAFQGKSWEEETETGFIDQFIQEEAGSVLERGNETIPKHDVLTSAQSA